MTNSYLSWLIYYKLEITNNLAHEYSMLFSQLHEPTQFVVTHSTDINLMRAGLELRHEYYDYMKDMLPHTSVVFLPTLKSCTFLEMLIALAFESSSNYERVSPTRVFLDFIYNLKLNKFVNDVYDRHGFDEVSELVNNIVNDFEYGNYNPDGSCGGCVIIPCLNVREAPIIVQGRLWVEYIYNKGINPEDFYGYNNV